jgi:hypothetical protein
LFVTLSSTSPTVLQEARVWWGTEASPSLNISRSKTVSYSADGTKQILRFDLYEHPKWRGIVTTLWIQPFVSPSDGATFAIESIAFSPRFRFESPGDPLAFEIVDGVGTVRHGTGRLYGRTDSDMVSIRARVDAPSEPFTHLRISAGIEQGDTCSPNAYVETEQGVALIPLTGFTCTGEAETHMVPFSTTGRIQGIRLDVPGAVSGGRHFFLEELTLLPPGPSFELKSVDVPSTPVVGDPLTAVVTVENLGTESGVGPKVVVGGQVKIWPAIAAGESVTTEFNLGTVAACGQPNLANIAVSGQFPGSDGYWTWPDNIPVSWLESLAPVPLAVPSAGSPPTAISTADVIVLENEHIRLALYKDSCLGGFGYLRLFASEGDDWVLLGERRGLAMVSAEVSGSTESWDLTAFELTNLQSSAGLAAVSLQQTWTDTEGGAWTVTHDFSLQDSTPRIDWTSHLEVSDLRVVRRFDGPGIHALGVAGDLSHATFGGLEMLKESQPSSQGLWLSTVDALRSAPDPDLITMPGMAAASAQHQLTMTWDSNQEWSLGYVRPQPRFSARDGQVSMYLTAPRVHEHVYPDDSLATVEFFINPGVTVELEAGFYVSSNSMASFTSAVRSVTGILSPGTLSNSDSRALTRLGIKSSYSDSGWFDEGASPSRRGDLVSAAAALAAVDSDSDLSVQVASALLAMSVDDLLPSGVGSGRLDAMLMHPAGADAMVAASTLLSPSQSLPGLSDERVAWSLLQLANFTGLNSFLTDGLSRLQALEATSHPTGGLIWADIPRGAPDVAACTDGIMAAIEAWRLAADPVWLNLARQYAHRGLQFVLATDLPGAEYSRYSVTAAIASTDSGQSKLGLVSDALGARLARAFLELHAEASEEAWDIVAEGILATIANRQGALGTGRLDDGYDLRRRQSYGETRLGHVFGDTLLALGGESVGVNTASVTTPDGGSIHIASLSQIASVSFDVNAWALIANFTEPEDTPQWVFVGGLSDAPPSVKADNVLIAESQSLGVISVGWDYETALQGMLVKLPSAVSTLQVEFPVPDIDMDSYPANIDCDDFDPDVFPGQTEVCNDKDDNCVDGVDEPEVTGWLECGIGACAHMEPACVGGIFVECDPFYGQSAEECDGLDNDCDGDTDEDVGTITCGVGQCAHTIYACDACDAFLGATPEVCDSVDNDCDGVTDESPGTVVCGLGACAHVISVCEECDPLLGQGVEVCNLIDDDCDGETDEGQPTVLCGTGACLQEIAACAPCDPTAGAIPEICNAIDDDCDGETDEDTPTIQCGTGICEHPVPACQPCDPMLGSMPEICNGLDDDCNGVIDDATGLKPCGTGQCYQEIDKCAVCDPMLGAFDEVCDGQDNDCDGETDEIAGAAVCGLGVCAYPVAGCSECDPTLGASDEVCDGLDNDCDGATDEVDDLGLFICGLGQCEQTVPNCTDGALTPCDAFAGATDEICDGEDNDCDGITDEDIETYQCGTGQCEYTVTGCTLTGPQACQPFLGAETEICDGIDNDCDGSTDEEQGNLICGEQLGCPQVIPKCIAGSEQFCHPVTGLAPEICDGIDNDCDSFTDEDQPVVTCGQGLCLHTVPGCEGGELNTCDPLEGAVVEVCNFVDDDCDGETDESSPEVTCGLGACQQTVSGCMNGAPELCVPLNVAKPDVCNGIDDDCDGETDENQGDITCGLGACEETIPLCLNGVVQECDPQTGAAPEQCDGLDNDCDGETDEDLGTAECGQGECRRMIAACSGGSPTVCDPYLGLQSETCDGLDNDCDGETDESLGNLTCTIQGAPVQVPGCQNGKSISCDDVASGGIDSGDGGSVGDDATTTVEGGGVVAAPAPTGSCSAGITERHSLTWWLLIFGCIALLSRAGMRSEE